MASTFYPATAGDYFLAALERHMCRSGQGRHFGVTVVRLRTLPDIFVLQERLRHVYAAHPVLGARLKRRLRGWQLGWEAGAGADAPLVMMHDADVMLDDAFIARVMQHPEADAPVQIQVFQDPAVLIVWRHGLIDGIGINLLVEQLATGVIAPDEPPAHPPARPFKQLWQHAKLGVETLRRITCEGSRSAWERGMTMRGEPRFRVIELDGDASARAVARIRQFCGEFFQMPFYAALAVRALRWLHLKRGVASACCHLEVPFQQGKRGAGAVFQNRMSMLLLPVREAQLDDLESAVTEVMASYKDALRSGLIQATDALMQLAMHLPVSAFMPFIRFQNEGEICSLFHSHTGTFLPGIEVFAGAAVENIYNIPSVSAPPGIGIFFSDYAGRLTATVAWREGCLSDEEQQSVFAQLTTDLTGQP